MTFKTLISDITQEYYLTKERDGYERVSVYFKEMKQVNQCFLVFFFNLLFKESCEHFMFDCN